MDYAWKIDFDHNGFGDKNRVNSSNFNATFLISSGKLDHPFSHLFTFEV